MGRRHSRLRVAIVMLVQHDDAIRDEQLRLLAVAETRLAQEALELEELAEARARLEEHVETAEAHAEQIAAADPATQPLRALTRTSPLAEVERALRAMALGLDGTDPLRRRIIRAEAVRRLGQLDIGGPAALVDAALATATPANDRQGTALELVDPEPWGDLVCGSDLLAELSALYARYVVVPDGGEDVLALWTAASYVVDEGEHTGYVALVSATPRCGKTTTLRVIESLARRAMRADCITAAALYRIIESWSPTLLVDELDRMHPDSDVWPILLSGHTRGATVPRCVGDDHEPRLYRTYGARAIAYTRRARCPVPDALDDRCIVIQMSRRRASESRARLRTRTLETETEPIRRRLMRWAADFGAAIGAAIPDMPDELDDRAADCWEALTAIADHAGGTWPARARELAVQYSAARGDDDRDAPSVMVLGDVVGLVEAGRLAGEHLVADEMCRALRDVPERPWATWGRDSQGLRPESLARLLRPHGIRTRRVGGREARARRYAADEILAAAERYADPGDTHTPGGRVGSTRPPVHPTPRLPLSDRQHRAGRVDGSDPDAGAPHTSADVSDPDTADGRRRYEAPRLTRREVPRGTVARLLRGDDDEGWV